MRDSLLQHLACPACRAASLRLEVSKRDGDEILEGALLCAECPRSFPVVRGIPRMLPEAGRYFGDDPSVGTDHYARAMRLTVEHYSSYQGKVSTIFSDTMNHRAIFEARTGLPVETVAGRLCLDAGCGNGRNTRLMGDSGAAAVIGLDAGFAVDEARRRAEGRPNVHFVQGDILRPPFPRGHFEFAISMGVLHHTVEPDAAFRSISGLVRGQGIFSVYLYGRPMTDWRSYGSARSLLGQLRFALYTEPVRRLVVRLPDAWRYRFCQLMWLRRRVIDALAKRGAPGRLLAGVLYYATPQDVHMPLESARANITRMYDTYSTPYAYSHEVEEVVNWFEETGDYPELLVTPYRVCVTGWKGPRADGEPVVVRYHPKGSLEAMVARGRGEGEAVA